MNIDEVHELIDDLEQVIDELNNDSREEVEASDLYQLSWIVEQVLGFGTAYSPETWSVGIAAPLLNKIRRMRGSIRIRDARIVADRLRSYLRGLDQRTHDGEELTIGVAATADTLPNSEVKPEAQPKSDPVSVEAINFSFSAERWALVGSSGGIKAKIHALSHLLDTIVEQTRSSNLPSEERTLSDLERNQLIAVLETALALLRAPMVEKGMLRKTGDMLKQAAGKAATKGVETGLGKLAGVAAEKIGELIDKIF